MGERGVEACHVCLEALWRLCYHLGPHLEDGDGELGVGVGGEPEAKVIVWRNFSQPLHHLVERRHPAEHQVTIRQKHPLPLGPPVGHKLVCHHGLPLPKRERAQAILHAVLLGECCQAVDGVDAWREDEDERERGRRVGEDEREVEGRRVHVLAAQVVDDEGGSSKEHAIRTQGPQHGKALQLVERALPVSRERTPLGCCRREPLLPSMRCLLEGSVDVTESREEGKRAHALPCRL
mmetsp:Transcript_45453/g.92919  ORF Transcript_45453/g.92919 Transcript_45453/m.92919 type:complete len:236 (-) Transcript_45453:278-985(-)